MDMREVLLATGLGWIEPSPMFGAPAFHERAERVGCRAHPSLVHLHRTIALVLHRLSTCPLNCLLPYALSQPRMPLPYL